MKHGLPRSASRAVGVMTGSAMLVLLLVPAGHAEITQGPCDGTAAFSDGLTVAASDPADVPLEIPEADTVSYEARIDIAASEDPVDFSGEIVLSLPIGNWALATWSGETTELATSGTYAYDAPSWVPRGSGPVPLEVSHTHGDVLCRANFRVAVAGSPWNLASILILCSAIVFGIAAVAAGVRTVDGTGRPMMGLVTGFLFGLLGAATLFVFGGIALDSAMFLVLPLLGIVLGVGMGVWAPFGADAGPPAGGDRTPTGTTSRG